MTSLSVGPTFGPSVLGLLQQENKESQQIAYNRSSKATKRRFDEVRAAIEVDRLRGKTGGR